MLFPPSSQLWPLLSIQGSAGVHVASADFYRRAVRKSGSHRHKSDEDASCVV